MEIEWHWKGWQSQSSPSWSELISNLVGIILTTNCKNWVKGGLELCHQLKKTNLRVKAADWSPAKHSIKFQKCRLRWFIKSDSVCPKYQGRKD